MNRTAVNIKNRLSLRNPQWESLNILSELADKLNLKKNSDLKGELDKVKKSFPTCTDFERKFPSLCFALATGVGKTRLMGAFISYLYIEKGIKNYFVLAPNLTIYNKLISDFSDTSSPKYVFKGISEFVQNPPRIITGENYNDHIAGQVTLADVTINIFNISKINAESKKGKEPRMKRLSEYIGQSYYNYLSKLDDLVLVMDESHHYRADRGMEVLNELNPILGLELTATPQVEKSGGTVKFKNVVYEYSLARAIRDGFVKDPAVATRKNFNPDKFSPEELDRIKLIDGIHIHEDTKVALDIYARNNNAKYVKPFVLVVAKDTDHAAKIKDIITSNTFFDGYYADKVMEINSKQKGLEKDENIQQLLSVENPENKIEIVIHVNMLKEGWDVTNLYTIIPLRTAASTTLREQTIGRGLRLPYGKKTGDEKVDRLTIVSHDKFKEIVDEANRPDSIIKKENIITIEDNDFDQPKQYLQSLSNMERIFKDEHEKIETIKKPEEKKKAEISLEAKEAIYTAVNELYKTLPSINDIKKDETEKIVIDKIKERAANTPQLSMFPNELIDEVKNVYKAMVEELTKNIIEIPRIILQQSENVKSGYKNFDLDTAGLNLQPGSHEIMIERLRDGNIIVINGDGAKFKYDSPENMLVNELINYPEIDYDEQKDLLFKLAGQAINKFKTYLNEEQIISVVVYSKREIGQFIYTQMKQNFYYEIPEYKEPIVYPFTKIEQHNYSKYTKDNIYYFRDTIEPTSSIPSKVFTGFMKACHNYYKFDNKTEKDFAILLEQSNNGVLKWLRPAPSQFNIYWDHNSRRYEPDFIAETDDTIYMVETKAEKNIKDADVREKAKAALVYCKYASQYTMEHGGKEWKYVLIPHSEVQPNMSFMNLMYRFGLESI